MSKFTHLSIHTDKSLKDSLVTTSELLENAKEKGFSSIAVTDEQNLFGFVKFYQKALSSGIKPIAASEINLLSDDGDISKLNLFCKDNQGYQNLISLLSKIHADGHFDPKSEIPACKKDWLSEHKEGLIVATGGVEGRIGKSIISDQKEKINEEADWLIKTFGKTNVYLEIQRLGREDDEVSVHETVALSKEKGLPLVATNPCRFINWQDYEDHEIRTSISKGITIIESRRDDKDEYTPHMYLKTEDEMVELFDDIPSAVKNTQIIAERCNLSLEFGNNYLPNFEVPEGRTESDHLKIESEKGLNDRLDRLYSNQDEKDEAWTEYKQRLDYELDVINNMGFPGYFLIVSDFIQWSKNNNIPVGPGRGSGAGSLVAFSLGITDLDPLKYDLLFERFLNPERVSMPDFDVDFCMDRRDEVIDYVSEKYGHDAVSQIITFGTMAAKMAVRDVTRAKGYSYGLGDRISKMIPADPGLKIKDALEQELQLQDAYERDQKVKEVIDHSIKLEGLARQTGTHAGGVLIAPGRLDDYTPTFNEPDGKGFVSQYDKDDVETAGLVKFDFLGLRTLTIIQNAVDQINLDKSHNEKKLNILDIDMNDESVFDIFREGRTTAVFQVESSGMKELLEKMRPDSFEDVIALVALYRPGPLQSGMVDNFVNRKHGREEVSYPDPTYQHETLKPILEPTYGIILYQEQVMQIAQKMAGYTLGEADLLRRAMGKKKIEEMEKQREKFQQGARENGIDADLAIKIFDLVEKFAGYGFNKSHSAAYALISYQTAWLKQHYPAHFMASVLSSDMNNTSKIVSLAQECENMGINVEMPDVNTSDADFSASSDNNIQYGLRAIKGLGDKVIEKIIEERDLNGEFKSYYDFVSRVNPNINALRAAIESGSMDCFGYNRATMEKNADIVLSYARKDKKDKEKKTKKGGDLINDMFSDVEDENPTESIPGFKDTPENHKQMLLKGERKTLGHYMSDHPMNSLDAELEGMVSGKLSDLMDSSFTDKITHSSNKKQSVKVAGVVMAKNIKYNTRGHSAQVKIDDGSSQVEVRIFNNVYNDCQMILNDDAVLFIEGTLGVNKWNGKQEIVASEVKNHQMIRDQQFSHIEIKTEPHNLTGEVKKQLSSIIEKQPIGLSNVKIAMEVNDKERVVPVSKRSISITDDFIHECKILFGEENITLKKRDQLNNNVDAKESMKNQIIEEGNKTRSSRFNEFSRQMELAQKALSA